MTSLAALWLPILLSAVLVFLASSVINMATPWHKHDYRKVPDESRFQDAVRPLGLTPGGYMVPRAMSGAEARSAEFTARMQQGPVVIMSVLPSGAYKLGRNLAQWFLYLVVVSLFAGYIASRALPAGADYPSVFRFVGTSAFLAYALALWQDSIWYGRSWSVTFRATVDGLLYALLTAGVFGWLWPR